jgi:hypothetical protein
MQAQYLEAVRQSKHMPDWAKMMAIASVGDVPFAELRAKQAERLKRLLSHGAPAGLRLDI